MSGNGSAIEAHHAGEHDAGHDTHDDHGGGHGHGADPNAGVVKGEPPTPAWVATAFVIAGVTALASIWLAFAIR